MVKLAREITIAIVADYGAEEMLRRLSHPYWFQAFGCILGFDWHSSGVTTTLCGAVKEGIKGLERDLGLFVAGGKGATSRRTPSELQQWGERISINPSPLVYASRMSAKVDSSAVQDGYQLYHHAFFFTSRGSWAVVQQGMNEATRYARRYHWLGEAVADFVNEPHSAILSETRGQALNLVASESDQARNTITEIATNQKPEDILLDLKKIKTLSLPPRHHLRTDDIHPDSLKRIISAGLTGSRGKNTPRPQPDFRACPWCCPQLPRPRPLQLRPRRQRWHPLPRGPQDLRPVNRGPKKGNIQDQAGYQRKERGI